MTRVRQAVVLGLAAMAMASLADAEPMFLSKQYTRCTTCHFSPTGGGLLTPYGRSLSRQELSTTGRKPDQGPGPQPLGREESFLWGAFGTQSGPLSVGIDLRPAHLGIDVDGQTTSQDFFMTADLLAAFRANGWTAYGEVGREPLPTGAKIDSYEYWVEHESEGGFGIRVGRFLPAYGVRFADHTAYTRANFGLDVYDQVYGVEVSQSWAHRLLQVSLGPGYADSVLHDDGRRAFTATARFQADLSPRSVLVVSGLFRDSSQLVPMNGAGGVAYGFAPISRLSIWSEGDVQLQQNTPGAPAYTLLNETAFEVVRGLWLKVSPQIHTNYGDASGGFVRLAVEADLLPRTHWNVDISYYHDRNRTSDLVIKTWLAQLHLYL